MFRKKIAKALLIASFAAGLLVAGEGGAAAGSCRGTPINPVTDVCWQCMFPARFGGFQFGGGDGSAPGKVESPVCGCASGGVIKVGLSVAFWELARLVETVKDPWCMPALGSGLSLDGGLSALLGGSNKTATAGGTDAEYSNQQVHYYYFPAWMLLNLFVDFPCVETYPFDVAYITEVDPLWNDDVLTFFLNPEALLFGNPITQLACMADTVSATVGAPLDPLFWCQGSWGSAYPLNGSSIITNPVALNAGLAARMIYKLSREGLLWDTAVDNCAPGGVLMPIWNKSNYKLQIVRPRRGNDCIPIGRPDMLWGTAKNPPWGTGNNSPDNFLWALTRARTCCVGYTF